jgi:hypothetical protein
MLGQIFIAFGIYCLIYGSRNPRQDGYSGNDGGAVLEVRYPVTFPLQISNCSKKIRDQKEIESCTTFSDGRRYYI